MQWLVDKAYPDIPVIRVVLDNLNTHKMASLYETFPAAGVPPTRPSTGLADHGGDRVQCAVPGLRARA